MRYKTPAQTFCNDLDVSVGSSVILLGVAVPNLDSTGLAVKAHPWWVHSC